MKRLTYLESLRGLAALAVVFNHLAIAFYPALFFGPSAPRHTGRSLEAAISGTPLNLLYNGAFSVSIFFVLSGFVLSYGFFRDRSATVALLPLAVKRYVRLLPPVLFSVLLAYVLLRFSLLWSGPASAITGSRLLAAYLNFQPDLGTALTESFIGAFFRRQASYNGVLWTMTYEFSGSILVYLFIALFGRRKRRSLAYLAAFAISGRSHFTAFLAGMLLCDLYTARQDLFGRKRYLPVFAALLAAGLLLGSYPSGRTVEGTLYALLPVSWSVRSCHMIGAVLVMAALLNLPRLQELLSRKAFAFLGRISFSQYILHFPIAATVGCAVFVSLAPRVPYHAAFLVTFLVTMPVIMIASLGTYTFIDEPGMRLSRIVYDHALSLQGRVRLLRDRLVPRSLKSHPLYRALFGLGSEAVASAKCPGPDPQA